VFFQATEEIIHNWDLLKFCKRKKCKFFHKNLQELLRRPNK
jgi:hypothetical protein